MSVLDATQTFDPKTATTLCICSLIASRLAHGQTHMEGIDCLRTPTTVTLDGLGIQAAL
ncbi:hypothetical protein LPH50_02930 [Xylella taiwanensis]|uniref:Uncharacterized protein n=2 Tax=Xylella taiwanensis TaxID=1444770 RepID=Z9JM93_9GAMM|nr:hypothetical protein [Xylella taiwanensis]EWS79078.1 hypothetical protein AF72_02310 [Xylella taiwanensis]MCD8457196.1 hypothetical protein [Xylella taiwanensis]MCD8459605.1 hypothetical protein [Xylella taiwanensis]MCD8461528.1 hypothetical protein [Xylella taiwanensis]MCD8462446.1 hypothetical protein [Xylella taiwanensis]